VDRLPRVLNARVTGRKKQDDRRIREILARVLDAILLHRQATMRYASASSKRTKEYVVEPQRIAYAHGGIYLVAWVPEYGEMRTFAVERMQTFGLRDEGFQPRALPAQPFAHSLGVNTGRPEAVVVEFAPDAAPYVREREWHQTQTIEDRDDGSIVLRMQVCNDHALRAWVLSFGASARVVAPSALAHAILEQATATRRRYLPPPRMLTIKAS
jgi:predicted DNA-binding transcriptional regulator YafY